MFATVGGKGLELGISGGPVVLGELFGAIIRSDKSNSSGWEWEIGPIDIGLTSPMTILSPM